MALALLSAVAPAIADDEALVCPDGTELHGKAPPDGQKQWCERPDGVQHGPSRAWDVEGNKRIEAVFDEGTLRGLYRTWHANGQLAEESPFDDDHKHGMYRSWYEDGQPFEERDFRDLKPAYTRPHPSIDPIRPLLGPTPWRATHGQQATRFPDEDDSGWQCRRKRSR